jgi:hypothetical protein
MRAAEKSGKGKGGVTSCCKISYFLLKKLKFLQLSRKSVGVSIENV